MTLPPIRTFAEDDAIRSVYGEWDPTEVSYSWSGLIFPEPK
jgi:hypothetical protein